MSPEHGNLGRVARKRLRPVPFLVAAGSFAALLALAACSSSGSSSGSQASATKTTNMIVAITPTIASDSLYVAQQLGYFKQDHLNVSIKIMSGGAAEVPALVSGSIQVGESAIFSEVQAAVSGLKTPCFSAANALNTSTQPPYYVALIGGKGITSEKDLVGKTIAVNGTNGETTLLVKASLAKAGVDYNKVNFVTLNYPDMPSALASGRVSAVMASQPFTTEVLDAGGNVLDPAPMLNIPGNPPFACWTATTNWLNSNKDAAESFSTAMAKADAYITAHPDYFRKVIGEENKLPANVLQKVGWPPFTSKLSTQDITDYETAAKQYGMLTTAPDPSKVLYSLSGS